MRKEARRWSNGCIDYRWGCGCCWIRETVVMEWYGYGIAYSCMRKRDEVPLWLDTRYFYRKYLDYEKAQNFSTLVQNHNTAPLRGRRRRRRHHLPATTRSVLFVPLFFRFY
ncbi:hypothetical protein L1987_18085 [Smallanthus sonchifolius]|uniref:Uncharacterized protein n=1 Tax=Smallanthus sonchifolius TaxID=185202 RepID=A0ACB9J0X1_9ASTR|nr:hypothetical protein L1987_18085 [Smallanthus sonchifolius]